MAIFQGSCRWGMASAAIIITFLMMAEHRIQAVTVITGLCTEQSMWTVLKGRRWHLTGWTIISLLTWFAFAHALEIRDICCKIPGRHRLRWQDAVRVEDQ